MLHNKPKIIAVSNACGFVSS